MPGIHELTCLVPPPVAVVNHCDEESFAAAQTNLGVTLPRALLDLGAAYGSGQFRASDDRYLRVGNPGSRWFVRTVRQFQAMYADNQRANGPKYYPHPFHPADPGLLMVATGDSPVALFARLRANAPDGRVVALTLRRTWVEFADDLAAVLAAVVRGDADFWQRPGARPWPTWVFVPDAPEDPAAVPPILEAVLMRDLARVRALADSGADLNQAGLEGRTPLCSIDDEEMVRLLLKLGADPNQPDADGNTPLGVACSSTLPAGGVRPAGPAEGRGRPESGGRPGLDPAALGLSEQG